MEDMPSQWVTNPNNISSTDLDQFNQTLNNLMGILITQVSLGSSSLNFAVGDASFSSSRKVYARVQCTPDISKTACRICLQGAVQDISNCCGETEGERVLRPSYIVRFESFKFYKSTFAKSHSLPSPPTSTQVIPPISDNSPPIKTGKGVSIFIRLVSRHIYCR
uniref:Gnk2-homologous domain-containing protein n=1 Tax=Quercus lobata TaxID=97700 RepID=A0A7N2LYH1_QUELO